MWSLQFVLSYKVNLQENYYNWVRVISYLLLL